MKYLILLLTLVLLTGCATTFQPPEVCNDGKSVILEITDNPTNLHKALLIANVVALENDQYTAQEALQVIDDIEARIRLGISYAGLYALLSDQTTALNHRVGVAAIILGPDIVAIQQTGKTMIISECDRTLILGSIAEQRQIVSLYL